MGSPENYRTILEVNRIVASALISIYCTSVGFALSIVLNAAFACSPTKGDLLGRRSFAWFLIVPMYFADHHPVLPG